MKKRLVKSLAIAAGVSIITGIINFVYSSSEESKVVGAPESVQSLPWAQTLLIMLGAFIVVFILLIIYYFVIKRKVESINP